MGLRTASYAEVMAPALTDPAQKQSFSAKCPHEADTSEIIMSESPTLGMGLHKDASKLSLDLPVDEIMQVMKEEIVEKFLTDVDIMNISMEDQPNLKELQAKETLIELKQAQSKIERHVDCLLRRLRKLQARTMGVHFCEELAGVYEYVYRSLKRLKDNNILDEDTTASMKPMSHNSTKTLLKKLEMTVNMQATSGRQRHHPKYFGSGSSEPGSQRINVPGIVSVPPFPVEHKLELQKVTGMLQTEVGLVQQDVDSEATESSSGGESCDEMQSYNNPHQQYLSIEKRALWKYASQRAAIASRWTWLQAQIADLEYRIRQHGDIHRQIRAEKGEVRLSGAPSPAVNGYRGQLPGDDAAPEDDDLQQCARTRPLHLDPAAGCFKKRKLLQLNGLHVVSKKAARPSTTRCACAKDGRTAPCAVCTGRTDAQHPRDATDALGRRERIALVDGTFHPVFSMPEDVSYAIHCEAIMKNPEWQQRCTRMKSVKIVKTDRSDKSLQDHRSKKLDPRKKYNRLLKPSTMSALSAKIKSKIRGRKSSGSRHSTTSTPLNFRRRPRVDALDEEVESIGNNSSAAASNSAVASPSSSPLLQMQAISGYNRRNRTDSYDIDNIVIPYSVAASTRVEKLQYKEILTPKWRIADFEYKCDKNNGAVRIPSQESDSEDLSEDAVVTRHDKSEFEEKKKFLSYLKLPAGYGRPRSHKRTDSLAESSGANTPDPLSPHPPETHERTPSPPPPDYDAHRRRTSSQTEPAEVAPYEQRTFPIDDETYEKMLLNMPENHQFQTNYRAQDSGEFGYLDDEKVGSPDSESTESALGDEDPNDPEWVDVERSRDRHKR